MIDYILKRIVRKRKDLGLSQKQMAEKLSTTQSNYNKLEKGKTDITIKRLELISQILEMPFHELLDRTNKERALSEFAEKQIDVINKLENENEKLIKDLKSAKKAYRGYYLLLKKLYFVFIDKEFLDKSENEITLADLNRKWIELQDSYEFGNNKDLNRYLFENPEGFGFSQTTIGVAIDIARSRMAHHIENYLNSHPDEFGFSDDIMSYKF